jgi:hypothetical protein
MEIVTMQRDVAQLGRSDLDAGAIAALVQFRVDPQPGGRAGVANQVDDGFEGPERAFPPVRGDVTEETMLDLVPLARPGREVTGSGSVLDSVE